MSQLQQFQQMLQLSEAECWRQAAQLSPECQEAYFKLVEAQGLPASATGIRDNLLRGVISALRLKSPLKRSDLRRLGRLLKVLNGIESDSARLLPIKYRQIWELLRESLPFREELFRLALATKDFKRIHPALVAMNTVRRAILEELIGIVGSLRVKVEGPAQDLGRWPIPLLS